MMPAIANHLWQSSVCAMVAAILVWALRRNRAAVRYWVWIVASLKFLMPLDLLTAIGQRIPAETTVPIARPEFAGVLQGAAQPFTTGALPPSPAPLNPLPLILAVVWGCGLAAAVVCRVRQWRRACASPSLEPVVFGVFRPRLMLPRGIEKRLTPPQLVAVLAHEMCHVRRRDNLFASIHMLVEALFWFHPAVWWIGARLVEERERACDEEVIRLGNDPQAYASGILEVCKFYLESPLVCACGITGADLKKRIEAIMTARALRRLTLGSKALLAAAACTALAVPLLIGILRAQTDSPTFEVASVKPADPALFGVRMMFTPGGGVRIQNAPLLNIIMMAYNLERYQISGNPAWLDSEQYVIEGKPPAGSPQSGQEHARQRLQQLLAERFRLQVRRESKEGLVYHLFVAKNGPKLKQSSQGQDGITGARPGQWTADKVDMQLLARMLSMVVAGPVVDRTGLEGTYSFSLEWSLDLAAVPAPKAGIARMKADAAEANPPDPNGPTIFTALQEQLGLRLEPARGPVETIVIERVERPAAN